MIRLRAFLLLVLVNTISQDPCQDTLGTKVMLRLWICLVSAAGIFVTYLLFYATPILEHPLPAPIQLKNLRDLVMSGPVNHNSHSFTLRHPAMIQPVAINEDEVVHSCKTKASRRQHLKISLTKLNVNVSKSYIISLTSEKQLALVNSTSGVQGRRRKIESFHEKGPAEFLTDYKSPCWFNENYQLRCLPYFLLAGVPKAGTTDVYDMLLAHPDFKPILKEPHWLARGRLCRPAYSKNCVENSFDKYTERIAFPLSSLLTTEANASKSMNKSTGENMSSEPTLVKNQSVRLSTLAKDAVTGDCSASTLWDNYIWKLAEENPLPLEPKVTNADYVYNLYNRTRTIVILRNPITRLYSEYIYFDATHKRGPAEFHEAVVSGVKHFYDCLENYSVRSCVYSPTLKAKIKGVRLYIGIYFIHLQDWFRVFPRDQVFVIQLEDYTNHRTETVRKLYDFLDLSMTLSGPKYDTRWT